MSLLSVIVPCYNEEESVELFYTELIKNDAFFRDKGVDIEILYINDGSKDNTVAEVKKLHEKDERVRLISFSRNFGKEAAMYAGLQKSKGDYVVIMDVDLQDPPSLLPEMFSWVEQGYDSVATRRVSRKGEPPIRSFFARMFYRLMKKISKTEMMDGARDYRLMTRQMVDAILEMTEYNRFTKGIFGWVGFETKWIEYENVERARGETKWNFWKLLLYSFDGITAFSTVSSVYCFFYGCVVLPGCLFVYRIYYCQKADFWRSGFRMAVSGMYYFINQWGAIFLYRYCGSVFGKDLHGGKEQTCLYCEGRSVKKF